MRKNRFSRQNRRKGFTLIECVVSIAIFVIMATLFATFMVSSVRVVNLTIANDRDREALLEAIAAADAEHYDTTQGQVTLAAVGTNGKMLNLNVDLGAGSLEPLSDKFVKYTAPNGTVYSIYLGASAMAVKYVVISNEADNQKLLDAITTNTAVDIGVTFKGDTEVFMLNVDARIPVDPKEPRNEIEVVKDELKNPYYVKYDSVKTDEKYLIYLHKAGSNPQPTPTP